MGIAKSAFGLGMKGITVASPLIAYNSSKSEGHGIARSLGAAGMDYLLYSELMGPLGWALMGKDLAVGAFKGANAMGKQNAKVTSQAYRHQFGGNFKDSDNAYTMRQRGIQAIQNNGLNARSVLGSEARQYFRGGR